MKQISLLVAMVMAGALALYARPSELDELKSDLVGQSMGGREKCWKFQSVEQIKELVITRKVEDMHQRVYTVSMQLQATNGGGKYAAQARIEWGKAGANWKIRHVGLLSLSKME